MAYELYYWPGIQGRGEFVRLALEEAGADYVDVARQPGGTDVLIQFLQDGGGARSPFAPPILKDGEIVIAHTAAILLYLGSRLGLAPADEAGRIWTHQLQLSVTDVVSEVHDTHHPVGSNLYTHEQMPEAVKNAAMFREHRMPKYLGYFERVLARNPAGSGHLVGAALSYADLSLFQLVEGLRYAFPLAAERVLRTMPLVVALRDAVAARPRLGAYLVSARRIPFNEHGIFRRYPELDG